MWSTGRLSSANFKPRPNDRGMTSVTHVECFGGPTYEDNAISTIEMLSNRVANYQDAGKIAIIRVANIERLSTTNHIVAVLEKPTRPNPCHAVIVGLEDLLACEHMATIANQSDVRSARRA